MCRVVVIECGNIRITRTDIITCWKASTDETGHRTWLVRLEYQRVMCDVWM